MNKLALVLTLVLGGVAMADSGAAADKPPVPAGSAAPSVGEPAAAGAKPTADQRRQTCVDAMNADPMFAASIAATVDKQIDAKTIKAHEDADYKIQKDQKHVIYAYAAMWVIAALFVAFLWTRQAALKAEIAGLRRDLEAAAKESK